MQTVQNEQLEYPKLLDVMNGDTTIYWRIIEGLLGVVVTFVFFLGMVLMN